MDVTTEVNKQSQIWSDGDLNWIGNAVSMYRSKLQEADGQGNETIKNELARIINIGRIVKQARGVDEFHRQPGLVSFSQDQLGKIKAVLLKYEQFLRYDLAESRKTASVRGQTEGKEKLLSAVGDMLANHPSIANIEPGEALVPTFLPRKSHPKTKIFKKIVNNTINIEKVIGGNFVGINQGTIIQNDTTALEALTKLLIELKNSDLDEAQKALAAAHVTMIQVQLTQPKPERGVIKKSFETLGNLANLIQAGNFAKEAAHWLKTAMTLVFTHHNLVDKINIPIG